MPKAKAECSGFTILWAKILLVQAEWGMWHINLLDSKSVLGACQRLLHSKILFCLSLLGSHAESSVETRGKQRFNLHIRDEVEPPARLSTFNMEDAFCARS